MRIEGNLNNTSQLKVNRWNLTLHVLRSISRCLFSCSSNSLSLCTKFLICSGYSSTSRNSISNKNRVKPCHWNWDSFIHAVLLCSLAYPVTLYSQKYISVTFFSQLGTWDSSRQRWRGIPSQVSYFKKPYIHRKWLLTPGDLKYVDYVE